MKRLISFYSNTKNNLRCVQAVMKMILAAKRRHLSFTALDDITHRHGKQWTWPAAAMFAMRALNFKTKLITGIGDFDYGAFAKDGAVYLAKLWTAKKLQAEAQHTRLYTQKLLAGRVLGDVTQRPATLDDIRRMFKAGWYVVPVVNSRALNRKAGFVSHWTLVTEIRKDGLTIHDPGLPAQESRRVSWAQFSKAFLDTVILFK